MATFEDDSSFFEIESCITYQSKFYSWPAMSPPVKTADEVRAACLGPVPKMGTGEEWMDGVKEEQQWENVALHPGTDQSGLFNREYLSSSSFLMSKSDRT